MQRALRNAELLRRLNVFTLCAAILVYCVVLGVAAYYRVGPLALFSTCIMIAELLVFQIVRTLGDHLEIIRQRAG
jgi:hypothetical protein